MTKLTRTPEGDWVPDDDHVIDLTSDNNQFGDGLASYLAGDRAPEWKILTCEICGHRNDKEPWTVLYHKKYGQTLCDEHFDEARTASKRKKLEAEAEAILSDVDGKVTRMLSLSGMRPIELSASIQEVPSKIANALATYAPKLLAALMAGEYPTEGIGITGIARIGKSLALTAIMRESFKAYLLKEAPRLGFEVERDGFLFCSWAHSCTTWRMNWDSSESWQRVKLVRELSTKPFVFIDDIGREGMSSGRTYIEDPCALLLNEIVSERHAYGRPMIWTSNLSPDALSKFYGPAMSERLAELAPPIEIHGATPITRGPHPVVK